MSNSPHNLFEHVAELTELYLRDEISADQLAELEALVRDNDQAADAMRTVLKQAGTMRVVFSEQQQFASRIGEVDRSEYLALLQTLSPTEEPEPVTLVGQLETKRPLWQQWQFVIPSAIAALLAIAVTLIVTLSGSEAITNNPDFVQTPDEPTTSTTPVATLTATHNARWAVGALAPGSPLHPNQRLTLTAGFAEITTNRGAVAILEAPCVVELKDNDNALRLISGKLVGICETDASKGFVVRTPHLDITDLGTRFGVAIDDAGNTLAEVFEGSVKATSRSAQNSGFVTIDMEQGDALAIDDAGRSTDREVFADTTFNHLAEHTATQLAGVSAGLHSKQLQWIQADDLFPRGDAKLLRSNDAWICPELEGHVLAEDLPVTAHRAGRYYERLESHHGSIPAGTKISSYLIGFSPEQVDAKSLNETRSAYVRLQFGRQVLGVIAIQSHWDRFDQLVYGDPSQALIQIDKPMLIDPKARSLRLRDWFSIQSKVGDFDFAAKADGNIDLIRVIVLEDEPNE